jgi:DNA-binding transcriptional MerR regulator
VTDADVSHLSIGEVLSLLQDEFPDVTISKIRFLESQGLIDPERTPSGYRKFYEADVERLRWILQQQRDHFLPLKVIKDRLLEADRANLALDFSPPPDVTELHDDTADPVETPSRTDDPMSLPLSEVAPAADPPVAPEAREPAPEPPTPVAEVEPEPVSEPEPEPVADAETPAAPKVPAVQAVAAPPDEPAAVHPMDLGPTEMTLTTDELSRMSGLSTETIKELSDSGLLATRQVGADRFFDSDAVVVARTAAKFAEFGVETRHLRMYKVASEREAGFFEQVIMPLLKQRNPTARQRAVEQVATMASLGQQLHAALLRQALDDSLG